MVVWMNQQPFGVVRTFALPSALATTSAPFATSTPRGLRHTASARAGAVVVAATTRASAPATTRLVSASWAACLASERASRRVSDSGERVDAWAH
jgi:hypothetical protein